MQSQSYFSATSLTTKTRLRRTIGMFTTARWSATTCGTPVTTFRRHASCSGIARILTEVASIARLEGGGGDTRPYQFLAARSTYLESFSTARGTLYNMYFYLTLDGKTRNLLCGQTTPHRPPQWRRGQPRKHDRRKRRAILRG